MSRTLSGDLCDLSPCQLYRSAIKSGFTGELTIRCDEHERGISFDKGDIVFARSTVPDDRLGEWLLREGRLRRSAYDEASVHVRAGRKLGAVLIQSGHLFPEDLREYVTRQVADIASAAIQCNVGAYEFVARTPTARLNVSTAEIVLRGVEHLRSWPRLVDEVGPLEQIYRISGEHDRLTTPINLSPAEWSFLASFNGVRSTGMAMDEADLSDFRLHQVLLATWMLAMLDRDKETAVVDDCDLALAATAGEEVEIDVQVEDVVEVDEELEVVTSARSRVTGRLNGTNLPDVLRAICIDRRNDVLRLERSGHRAEIRFSNGYVIAAGSTAPEQRIGQVLLRQGRLDRKALTAALEEVEPRALGTQLVRKGLVTVRQLQDALETQIRDVLLPAFDWTDATYTIVDAPDEIEGGLITPQVSTAQMIVEGVRRMQKLAGLGELFDRLGGEVRPSAAPSLSHQEIDLRPEEAFLLARIERTIAVADLVRISPLDRDDVCRILYAFLCVGFIEPAEAGVAAEPVGQVVARAIGEIADAPVGAVRDLPGREPSARDLYRSSFGLIRKRRYDDAIASLREAVRKAPREPNYHLLLGRVLARHPRWSGEAERHLQSAIELAPGSAESHSALGLLYKKLGLADLAEKMFARAVELDPEDPIASRETGSASVGSSLGKAFVRLLRPGKSSR